MVDWAQRRIEAITAALAAVESSEHDLTDLRNLMGDIESLFKKQIFKVYDSIPDNYFPQSNVQNDDQDDDDSDDEEYSYASYDDEEDFE
jgi:DNA-binding FadR family transcriptional regulator